MGVSTYGSILQNVTQVEPSPTMRSRTYGTLCPYAHVRVARQWVSQDFANAVHIAGADDVTSVVVKVEN
jgi:hypothetical protein